MKYLNTLLYSDRLPTRLLRHFLFWSVDTFNWLMVLSLNRPIESKDVYIFLSCLPLVICATYFILYNLIPKFSVNNQWDKLFIGILVTIILMGVSTNLFRHFVLLPRFDPRNLVLQQDWGIAQIILEIFRWLAVVTMAIAIKLIKNKTALHQKNQRLEAEKRAMELHFLKAQMHPHFLFNTLNTLYSETLQDSGKAEEVVLHLSNLLRFILEECNKDQIPIEKEIKVIRDYIALEKLRHEIRLSVNFTVTINPGITISPLIFLTFVENSIKHSLNSIRGTAHISIIVKSSDADIELIVVNDFAAGTMVSSEISTKTGLKNITQQLDLLYGANYLLNQDVINDQYYVKLKVPTFQRSDA